MKQSTNPVVMTINECFSATAKPEAQSLMNLYSTIGKFIAKEENSSFVAELAKEITKKCASLKGFSARNLRRMRDFHVTYSGDDVLLAEAKTIGWTQNTVIMERCDSLEEMAFYVALVQKQGLSKSELISEIASNAYETVKQMNLMAKVAEIHETVLLPVAPVHPKGTSFRASHSVKGTSKDTSKAMQRNVRPPVGKGQHFLQGSSPPRWKPKILMKYHLHRLSQLFAGNAYEKELWRASQIGVRAKMF
ncbi:MAG: DUF1016 N-terminal domain-containing protein [Eubacteriales bacterium]